MSDDGVVIHYDFGPPHDDVLEAVERHVAAKPRGLWKPKRVEVEEFFSNMAEEVKRAGGTP